MDTHIYLDFAAESAPKVLFAKQGDSDRTIVIHPLVNGVGMSYVNGMTATLNIRRPDGTTSTISGTVADNRRMTITATITSSALSVPGMAVADCSVSASRTNETAVLTSESFYINVREACADGGLG